jgi:acyl-CoA reductase-like NAD-dependent aldehyde dehydrogenase
MDGGGYFYFSTILADISDGTRLVDEVQFGPALPVIAYDDLCDAVERANATHFGLSGSVWSSDPEPPATSPASWNVALPGLTRTSP